MKKMSLLTALIAAVAVTAYSVSGTYAKYTSTFTGSDSARVAQWAFQFKEDGKEASNNFTFDLFNTINDTTDGSAETDVMNKTADGKTVIAPGTKGSFSIDIMNNSEVTANYDIAFADSTNASNIPVEFKVTTGAVVSDWMSFDELKAYKLSGETDKRVTLDMNDGSTSKITVEWKWDYESTKGEAATGTTGVNFDTSLGLAGNAEVTIAAAVTATQVD